MHNSLKNGRATKFVHAFFFIKYEMEGREVFIVIRLKKILIIVAAALLFLALTGIIFIRKNQADSIETSVIKEGAAQHILIIDAGHGGADGGAVAVNGERESAINLAIAQKLNAAAQLWGINTVMTRTSEELPYPESAETIRKKKVWDQQSRIELINSTENAVMISIHQNTYPDPRPCGPEVLYGKISGSEVFGEMVNEALTVNISPDNRRVALPASEKIFLMKSAECPAILVECGFISNEQELNSLLNDNYQRKIAAVLLSSYLQFIN